MEINKNLLWLETGEKGEKGMALTVRFTGRIGESAGMGLLLTGPDGYRLEQKLFLTEEKEAVFFCPGVNLWDPEHPFLYHAAVTLECGEKILAVREENIGFRTLEKAGKELLWNHTPLKLRGICYRERKEDREGTKKDLELFAAAHINSCAAFTALFPAICCSFVMKWVFWQRIRLLFMRWDRKSRLCRIFLIAGKSFSSL